MGISRGNITTNIIKNGLVFNADAANRASAKPQTNITTIKDTIGNVVGDIQNEYDMWDGSTISPSFAFDGSGDYVNFSTSPALVNSPRTVSFWFKLTSNDKIPIGLGLTNTNNRIWGISIKTTPAVSLFGRTAAYDEGDISVSTSLTSGNWTHLDVTWDGADPGTIKIYVNGIHEGTRVRDGGKAYDTSAGVRFGTWANNDRYFNGNLGPTQIYNRALSANEVLFNYNGLKSRFGL